MNNYLSLQKLTKLASVEYTRKNYSLDIMREALSMLGDPHLRLKNVIHITGTNGKGSTAFYTASILHEHGMRTGLYTSPHLFKVNERIMVCMKPVSDRVLNKVLGQVFSLKTSQPMTYFEVLTCAMFLCFDAADLDAVVLEVGLGGRLDATNVVEAPILSVITSISLDHTEVLGKTVSRIAMDKAGIIKPGSASLCAERDPVVSGIIKRICLEKRAKVIPWRKSAVHWNRIDFRKWETRFLYAGTFQKGQYLLPMASLVQPMNAGLAIRIAEFLVERNILMRLVVSKVRRALSIGIQARMQKLKLGRTEVIFDGGHNPAAVRNFVDTMALSGDRRMVVAVALMKEKDSGKVFRELSRLKKNLDRICVYSLQTDRSAKPTELVKSASRYFACDKVSSYKDMSTLLREIRELDRVYMIGSLYAMKEYCQVVRDL